MTGPATSAVPDGGAGQGDVLSLDEAYHGRVIRGLLGPILPYYGDPDETDPDKIAKAESVTEIMINGPHEVYVEDGDGLTLRPELQFTAERDLISLARAILQYVGKRLVPEDLSVEARTPEGHRVHIVQSPAARPGLSIAIRKFPANRVRMVDLVERHSRIAVKERQRRRLEARLNRENQFNRKVELNQQLRQLHEELSALEGGG